MKNNTICAKNDGISDFKDILNIETVFSIKLDSYFKFFLIDTNGGTPEKNVFDFVNINGHPDSTDVLSFYSAIGDSNIVDETESLRDRIPEAFIVIGGDSGGSHILRHKDNSIYVFDHHHEYDWDGEEALMDIKPNTHKIADNFEDFFNHKLYELPLD